MKQNENSFIVMLYTDGQIKDECDIMIIVNKQNNLMLVHR